MGSTVRDRALRTTVASVLSLAVALAASAAVYRWKSDESRREAQRDLLLSLDLQASALERFLESQRSEVVLWSSYGPVRDHFRRLAEAWQALGVEGRARVRQSSAAREASSPQAPTTSDRVVGETGRDAGLGDSPYERLHAATQLRARDFLAVHGYDDLYLIGRDGAVFFTDATYEHFGTNVREGASGTSGLGVAFGAAADASSSDFVAFTGFEPDERSGEFDAFMLSPVTDPEGAFLGVLSLRIGTSSLSEILALDAGLESEVAIQIVRPDLQILNASTVSDSAGSDEGVLAVLDSASVRLALAGERGVTRPTDRPGILLAYTPAEFQGTRWALLAAVRESDLLSSLAPLRRSLLLASLLVALAVALAGGIGILDPPVPLLTSPLDEDIQGPDGQVRRQGEE